VRRLLWLIPFLWCAQAWAAITYVDSAVSVETNTGVTSVTTSLQGLGGATNVGQLNVSAHDFLFMICRTSTTTITPVAPTDSGSNENGLWTQTPNTYSQASSGKLVMWYVKDAVAATGITFTCNWTTNSSFNSVSVRQYRGLNNTSPFDSQVGGTSGAASSFTTPSNSTVNPHTVSIMCGSKDTNATQNVAGLIYGSSSTNLITGGSGPANGDMGCEDLIVSTTQTGTGAISASGGTPLWTGSMTAFTSDSGVAGVGGGVGGKSGIGGKAGIGE
jgi:hypothetical protein